MSMHDYSARCHLFQCNAARFDASAAQQMWLMSARVSVCVFVCVCARAVAAEASALARVCSRRRTKAVRARARVRAEDRGERATEAATIGARAHAPQANEYIGLWIGLCKLPRNAV